MPDELIDLFIIGGGVNGAAIARDGSGRGLKVMLAEKGDFAGGTSSASSNLIHGGLRYLEIFDFKLVRESLKERDRLLRLAPHIVRSQRFLVPIYKSHRRSQWFVRLGLKIYDLMAGSKSLPLSGALSKEETQALPRLRKRGLKAVLHYSDCQTSDSRLVMALLLDARSRGANIGRDREVLNIQTVENGYRIEFNDNGARREVLSRFVINSGGPWANHVLDLCSDPLPRRNLRLVRGSHIVLKMPDPPMSDCYTLQNTDGRVVFALPWQDNKYIVVGTTDVPHEGDLSDIRCSADEQRYLLDLYNRYFLSPDGDKVSDDIVWSWSGVRPLVDDGSGEPSKVSRDFEIVFKSNGSGGFMTLYGGKLTSHRELAEDAIAVLAEAGLKTSDSWTGGATLYGGSLSREDLDKLAQNGPEDVPLSIRLRWVRTYGDRTQAIYDLMSDNPSHSRPITADILEAELIFSQTEEDTKTADDFLYRRTKLFPLLTREELKKVADWFGGPA